MCNQAVEYNVAVFSEILGCLIIWSDFVVSASSVGFLVWTKSCTVLWHAVCFKIPTIVFKK